MSAATIRRKLTRLLQGKTTHGKRNQGVPSKISEMELAAYDAIAYDEDEADMHYMSHPGNFVDNSFCEI